MHHSIYYKLFIVTVITVSFVVLELHNVHDYWLNAIAIMAK